MPAGENILKRYSGNPIITPRDFPGSKAVFNPGQTVFNGKTILLLSVLHNKPFIKDGILQVTTTHVAESEDGIHFDIKTEEPFIYKTGNEPYKSAGEQAIDLRITKIDDIYYIIHPGCGPWGTFGILGKTKDFKKHEYIDIVSLPDNRLPCLFPEKINGLYARLDRPYRVAPHDFHYIEIFGYRIRPIWFLETPSVIETRVFTLVRHKNRANTSNTDKRRLACINTRSYRKLRGTSIQYRRHASRPGKS